MQLSLIDILFLITVILLVFNGLRNGVIFSLFHLLSIPIGFAVAYFYGPRFVTVLAANNLPATPLISYIVLFLGVVLILHIVGTILRGFVKAIPLFEVGDTLLGGVIGFVEAWLIWLVLLIVLGNFLNDAQQHIQQGSQIVPELNIHIDQLQKWHDFYNQAITDSLFARVNAFFVHQLPRIPQPPR
ncbi:MAG: CvpA family protein [Ktedonobacteraceae bacterium]|nr:CvpA family protein [Ktedonobacteraceae bacterium]